MSGEHWLYELWSVSKNYIYQTIVHEKLLFSVNYEKCLFVFRNLLISCRLNQYKRCFNNNIYFIYVNIWLYKFWQYYICILFKIKIIQTHCNSYCDLYITTAIGTTSLLINWTGYNDLDRWLMLIPNNIYYYINLFE